MNNNEHSWQETLSEIVNAYDLEKLIAFSKQVPETDVELWRTEVMESGFMTLYSYFSYDQMCGKLGDFGLDLLDDVVESAEEFYGSPLRKLRAEVLHYRIDETKATHVDQAKELALRAVDELSLEIHSDLSALTFRARTYQQLAELDANRAVHYWKRATEDLKAAGEFSVWILYHQWPESITGMREEQENVRAEFNQRMNQYLRQTPDRIWSLLDDAVRMQEYHPSPELKKQLTLWLEIALHWKNEEAAPMLLRTGGLLLHKQGKAQQRAEYFAKAIECFEQFITKDRAHAMEVYYMASVYTDWAALEESQGNSGTPYLAKAWEVYREHEEIVRINFSSLLHYAEFLEQLYFNDQLTERPSQEEILSLAVAAEEMGKGYYSGPGMIQARIAIRHDDAETALYHLCRLLLRHELCIDDLIKNLRGSLTDNASREVTDFLDATLTFMADVSEGYYYDPAFSMEELNTLSRLETMEAWHQRQMEIRNRERLKK